MRPLEGFVQDNPMAGVAETVAELNILDGGARKALRVETAELLEYRATDGPTPGPQRRGLPMAVLVNEVV